MKNTKMLFLLVGTIMSAALNGGDIIDGNNETKKIGFIDSYKILEPMFKAEASLVNIIVYCHTSDGNHEARMNDLRDSSWDLSISQFNGILAAYAEFAKHKNEHNACRDCNEIAELIIGANLDFSKAEKAGQGDMSVRDFAQEIQKAHAQCKV